MKKSYIQNVCRNIKEKTQTDGEEATTFHSQQEMMVMVIMKMKKIWCSAAGAAVIIILVVIVKNIEDTCSVDIMSELRLG